MPKIGMVFRSFPDDADEIVSTVERIMEND